MREHKKNKTNPRNDTEASDSSYSKKEEIKFTEVKNAHASGMGSIGRNDEKLTDEEDTGPIDDTGY